MYIMKTSDLFVINAKIKFKQTFLFSILPQLYFFIQTHHFQ
jgi:hypothetical protein